MQIGVEKCQGHFLSSKSFGGKDSKIAWNDKEYV